MSVTPAYGVAPDASGSVRLRVVAFRVHCGECGYLSERHESVRKAQAHDRRHRGKLAHPKYVPLCPKIAPSI